MLCTGQLSYVIQPGDNLYQLSQYFHTTVPMILSMNPNIDPYNLQIGSVILICPGDGFTARQNNPNPPVSPNSPRRLALISDMRFVWMQHVYWTRMLLISIADRLNDLDAVTSRLLLNPGDIAEIFANYYPADTAKEIARLLTEHLRIGAALITASRDRRTAEADNLNRQWYINADRIADAFAGINPYYLKDEARGMLYAHLDLTKQEVAMRIAANYPEDIKAFGKVEQEAIMMADYFSSGILRQFPYKFS